MGKILAALLFAASMPAVAAMEDVPFVVTPDNVTLAMLQLAGVGPQDYVIDLGSGDGRIVILAAKRFSARGLGVEIDPTLVERSRQNARAAGVEGRAIFREQDLFKTDLSPASVITMYLLPEVNLHLRPRILALRPGTRVVSHDWDMGEWKPDKTVVVEAPDKMIGLEKASHVHLWIVPARVDGHWCGTGKARGTALRIEQDFQRFRARMQKAGSDPLELQGSIEGVTLRSPRNASLRLEGDRLKLQAIAKPYSPHHGGTFARARGPNCH
ncbi:MAG TPA: class I SAM-dependent methyltransferase [Usitatibacter sp.]|nr:class I SAM-dependent methyltransferase [Usitatibacter sp.]